MSERSGNNRRNKKEKKFLRQQHLNALKSQERRKSDRVTLRQFTYGLGFMSAALYSQAYGLHNNEFLSSYGKDFLAPAVLTQMGQFWSTAGRAFGLPIPERLTHSPGPFVAVALAYGYMYEAAQFYAKHKGLEEQGRGRFDQGDIAAETLGAIFAYGISRYINGANMQSSNPRRN